MTEFRDANGKLWQIRLTIETIDRINAILNRGRGERKPVDLLELADGENAVDVSVFDAMFASPRRMAAVLAEAVAWPSGDEAEGVELANGLRGDSILAAFRALFSELSCFFPESQRPILRLMLDAHSETGAKMGELKAKVLAESIRAETGKLAATGSPGPAGN